MLSRRFFFFVAVALLAVLLVRGDVQRWGALGLVAGDPVPAAGTGPVLAVLPPMRLVPRGDRAEETAAQLLKDRAGVSMIFHLSHTRVEALGATPPKWQLDREALTGFGIDPARIEVLDVEGHAQWDWLRTLRERLRESPEERAVILCDQFGSRGMRRLVSHVAPEVRERIAVVPLRDRRYDESNWWKSRLGTRHVLGSWFSLAAFYLFDEVEAEYLGVEEYVREAESRWNLVARG